MRRIFRRSRVLLILCLGLIAQLCRSLLVRNTVITFQQAYSSRMKSLYFQRFDPWGADESITKLVKNERLMIPTCEKALGSAMLQKVRPQLQPIEKKLRMLRDLRKANGLFQIVMLDLQDAAADLLPGTDNVNRISLFGHHTCLAYFKWMAKHPSIFDYHTANYSASEINAICSANQQTQDKFQQLPLPQPEFYSALHTPTLVCARNAGITDIGSLHVGNNSFEGYGVCLVGQYGTDPISVPHAPLHNRVFVISQLWGDNIYHTMAENLPRLAFYYEYLQAFADIKIHVVGKHGYPGTVLRFLGFDSSRIIEGPVLAKTVYYPEPSLYCGMPAYISLRRLQQIIHRRLRAQEPDKPAPEQRTLLIIIHRSHGRYLKNHNELEKAIRQNFSDRLEIVVFKDLALPSVAEIMKLFNRASIIIGPHGAAMSNWIACREGTVVIEYLGADEQTFCYLIYAFHLNLRYFGTISDLRSKHSGAIYANVSDTLEIIRRSTGSLNGGIKSI